MTGKVGTYEEWQDLGRGVVRGARPFAVIDGQVLFREEDTYKKGARRYSRFSRFDSGDLIGYETPEYGVPLMWSGSVRY